VARVETRLFVLMLCVLVALYVADRVQSATFTTVVLISFPLVFLTHIRAADTSHSIFGPVWLRRTQWALMCGLLLFSVLMVRVF
jgi:hypothetical protein